MQPTLPGLRAEDFIWAGGIEDTFIPQTKQGHRALDEYELIGHYEHWREDLALVRDTGLNVLRWGVPWYKVELSPDEFDWSWTDKVLSCIVHELGITPIVDLVHYGCPLWLRGEFASPAYPQAVARYAEAFARRYSSLVRWYTPLNEPLVNALMCGRRGLWPPYMRGNTGYARIMLQLVRGIIATVGALRSVDPRAVMVYVDAAGLARASRSDLESLAKENQYNMFLAYDLLSGKVTVDHPLFPWLVRHGAPPDELHAIASNPLKLDVLGLNYYPWSTQQLYINKEGTLGYRVIERQGAAFADLLTTYYQRYKAPIIITETSAYGTDKSRSGWMAAGIAATKAVRSAGVPVLGYTWFPVFTMMEWRYRFGRGPADQYRIELGLYKMGRAGQQRWLPTPLVAQLQSYMRNPEQSIGQLNS